MKNITLAIDEEVLDKARVIAAEKRTTVNALVRDYLGALAGRDEKVAEARRELLRLMKTSQGRMGADWKFSREDSHER
jgi:Arc/MetJ family transcription regulator